MREEESIQWLDEDSNGKLQITSLGLKRLDRFYTEPEGTVLTPLEYATLVFAKAEGGIKADSSLEEKHGTEGLKVIKRLYKSGMLK